MGIQTSINEQGTAVAGMPADSRLYDGSSRMSGVVESSTDLYPGTLAAWVDESKQTVQPLPDFEAAADDADGLIASAVSTAGTAFSASGTDFDGAVGAGEHYYGYRVTVTLDANTDWNDTKMEVVGKEAETGRLIREKLDIPDGGNATLTTVYRFSRVDSIDVEAQGGTGGSFTAGYLAADRVNVDKIAGIVLRRTVKEPDANDEVSYADEEQCALARKHGVYCEIEEDVTAGSRPYVRVTAGAGETKGAFRTSSDGGDAVPLMGSFRFQKDGDFSVEPLAPVELSL